MPSKFVFFSSHTHVAPFTATECMIGDVLRKSGVAPVFLKPARCTCKLVPNLAALPTPAPWCRHCETDHSVLVEATDGWLHDCLESYGEEADLEVVDRAVANVTPADVLDWSFEGIDLGKIVLHDVLLVHKQDHLRFSEGGAPWASYKDLSRASLVLALRFRRYLRSNAVSGVMVYNSHYSVNRVIFAIAQQEGVPVFSMHGGASLRYVWETLMFTRGDIDQHKPACVRNWVEHYHGRGLNSVDVKMVEGHFEELFAGKMAHAYSAPAGSTSCDHLFDLVNPEGNRKVLVAATSSADERFALEQSGIRTIFPPEEYLFPSQVDWLAFLVARMRESQDLALIIRVHPRELPNKREGMVSSNSERLRQLLTDLPPNVAVNWPSDGISFYDLLLRSDMIISCWSSVVLESSLFGCPIVLPRNPVKYFEIVADRVSATEEEYWADINEFAQKPWVLSRAIKTLRWLWMVQFASNVSLFGGDARTPSVSAALFEWLAKWHVKARKLGLRLPLKAQNYYNAFGREANKITRRRSGYEGERVVADTLLGTFDPLKDFRALQKLQSGAYATSVEGSSDELQERRDCLAAVQRLLSFLRQPGVATRRIDEMIRNAEAAISK